VSRSDSQHRYETTHPWINFKLTVEQQVLWASLGEALSKCTHLAGTPLPPDLARRLASTTLIRGAVATTAIEGNTLTVEDVQRLQQSGKRLPESQSYLQDEVNNVLFALAQIDNEVRSSGGQPFRLTSEWIREQNNTILKGLEVDDHVVPGEYTEVQLTVGPYRAAPPEDVAYLMDRLVDWLNEVWLAPRHQEGASAEQRFFNSFFAAVLAHLYIAWIHPFGDGNGRTARLVECAILAHCGVVPWVSSNLLSDHYNRTRSHYYRALKNASAKEDVQGFLRYSVRGYVDMLREQISEVQEMQRVVAWTNYVHGRMHAEPAGDTQKRRRELVLCLPEDGCRRSDVRTLNASLAAAYATKQQKTVSRDITRLRELGLIYQVGPFIKPSIDIVDAFRPATVS
jgi:Fic family protein